jgi:uncharacterized lipoprotein YajG
MRLIPLAVALVLLAGCASSPDYRQRAAVSPGSRAGDSSAVMALTRAQQRHDQRRHVCATASVRAARSGYC